MRHLDPRLSHDFVYLFDVIDGNRTAILMQVICQELTLRLCKAWLPMWPSNEK